MSEPHFKFSQLRRLLSGVGFTEVPVAKPYLGFEHKGAETLIVLPSYRNNSQVAPQHLAQVRVTLDASGLMTAEEFDRRVGFVPTRESAPS